MKTGIWQFKRNDDVAAIHRCEMFPYFHLLTLCWTISFVFVDGLVPNEVKSRSQPLATIDPLLTYALKQSAAPSIHVGGLSVASNGIRVWRHALTRGRLPIGVDFDENGKKWPDEPLFSTVCRKMADLQMPRFALAHPEIAPSVLISLIRVTTEYMQEVQDAQEDQETTEYDALRNDDQDFPGDVEEGTNNSTPREFEQINLDEIAEGVLDIFVEEWGGVVGGVSILDELFGLHHGLLSVDESTTAGAGNGFGLQDGIWKNTGWELIPTLQSQIAAMPELKDLVRKIGRRPTAKDSDKLQKFAPRRLQDNGGMGAQFNPTDRDSVSGVTLSGSFTEMLPSEAVLLRGSKVVRRLFMAKKLEEKLLSYQISGWDDVPSVPQTRPLYRKRLPSAPGGPIIVCLDTSWSMAGMREQLSKAVVLACVSQAHKQGRLCQVVAFSNERGVMEAGEISADSRGIQRLLDFLAHGFGGGTDVTGALKYVMTTLDTDTMASADILLISDGEIPDPPISADLMEELDQLKLDKEVNVHGLLVGKRDSKPLSRICSETHDFLVGYDVLTAVGAPYQSIGRSSSSLGLSGKPGSSTARSTRFLKRFSVRREPQSNLRARVSRYQDEVVGENDAAFDSGSGYLDEVLKATHLLREVALRELENDFWKPKKLLEERDRVGSCWGHLEELKVAVKKVGEGLIEREEESRLVVLSLMADEHILLLGVPGTGKSVLGRRLARLCNGAFFQRLLTRFTTPDELFGPLSLQSLENDEYRRCTSGFLPTASIAFLDEIFKANSAILNTLLTILNERKFDNAGGQEACPIRCVVGASNELPESEELAALFDRFLIRKEVHPLSDNGLLQMLSMANPGASSYDISDLESNAVFSNGLQNVVEELSVAADSVAMGDHICKLIIDLRTFMREEQTVQLSDRRLAKTARLLKLSAASHGRQNVDSVDTLLLQHCMWQLPEQKKVIKEWLLDNLTPGGDVAQFRFLLENLRRESLNAVRKTSGDVSGSCGGRKADVAVIVSLRKEVGKIVALLKQNEADLARHIEVMSRSTDFLWLEPEEAKSTTQILLPRANKTTNEVRDLLVNAHALELALSDGPDAPSVDLRLSVIDQLWNNDSISPEISFTDDELEMGMKEAKATYDVETFRKWKRERKKARK
eukprot:scaffold834_cov123-Cylindrotheca_fusiformis.AAC.33